MACSVGFSLVLIISRGTFLILGFRELSRIRHERDKTPRTTLCLHSETFFSPYKEKFRPSFCSCCHPSPQGSIETGLSRTFTPRCPMSWTSHCGHASVAIPRLPCVCQVGVDGRSAELGKLGGSSPSPRGVPVCSLGVKSILEPRLLVS